MTSQAADKASVTLIRASGDEMRHGVRWYISWPFMLKELPGKGLFTRHTFSGLASLQFSFAFVQNGREQIHEKS